MKLIYPLFERAYGESVHGDYTDEQFDELDKQLESVEEKNEKDGYIHFDDIEELILDGLTPGDKERLRKYIKDNAE